LHIRLPSIAQTRPTQIGKHELEKEVPASD